MGTFSFYMPTRLYFGAGSVKRLAKVRLPQGTGLIITGGTSTTKLGYVAKVADTLAEAVIRPWYTTRYSRTRRLRRARVAAALP